MSKGKKFEVKAELHFSLTQQDIDDIMVAALEGGINYWAGEAEVVEEKRVADWGHEQIARGGVLVIHDIEDPGETWELTLEKFLNGFKLWVEHGGHAICAKEDNGTIEEGGVDTLGIDAACADEIVQYALFGEMVFG